MTTTSGSDALAQITSHASLPANLQGQVAFYAKLTRLADQVMAGRHPVIKIPPEVVTSFPWHSARGSKKATTSSTPDLTTIHSLPKSQPSSSAIIDPVLLTKSDHLVKAEILLKRQRIERELQRQVDKKKVQGRDREFILEGPQRFDPQEVLARALRVVGPASGLHVDSHSYSTTSGASFEENSYYSSKANSWSSEEGEYSPEIRAVEVPESTLDASGKNNHMHGTYHRGRPYGKLDAGFVECVQKPAETHKQNTSGDSLSALKDAETQLEAQASVKHLGSHELEDLRDESYSPPAADAFNTFPPPAPSSQQDIIESQPVATADDPSYRRTQDVSSSGKVSGWTSPPGPSFPVVTSNIPAPFAPRPTRVSPLPVARIREEMEPSNSSRPASRVQAEALTNVNQSRSSREQRSARRVSDRGTDHEGLSSSRHPIYHPRKRRRDADVVEQPRQGSRKRIARSPAHSPEPYIKPEPASPPPFSQEPPRRLILRDNGQADIEVVASGQRIGDGYMREVDYPSAPSLYGDRPSYTYPREVGGYNVQGPFEFAQAERQYAMHEPASSETFRILSPAPISGLGQSDLDSRRVATYQSTLRPQPALNPHHPASQAEVQALQSYPPRQHVQYTPVDATPIRSFARPRSAVPPQSQYSPKDMQTLTAYHHQAPQYIQYSPRELHRDSGHVLMERSIMPPPPPSARRIVVDQYGNEYVAVPTSTRSRYSVAPEDSYASQRATSYQPVSARRERLVSVPEPYEYSTF